MRGACLHLPSGEGGELRDGGKEEVVEGAEDILQEWERGGGKREREEVPGEGVLERKRRKRWGERTGRE